MSFSKLIYTIAALIVGVWLLGIIFRFRRLAGQRHALYRPVCFHNWPHFTIW